MTEAATSTRGRKAARNSKIDGGTRAGTPAANRETAPSEGPSSSPAAKPESKTARVIALLRREGGATLDELVAETGWQAHTTRAALTGLRKKGHAISNDKVDGVRRYRVAAAQ